MRKLIIVGSLIILAACSPRKNSNQSSSSSAQANQSEQDKTTENLRFGNSPSALMARDILRTLEVSHQVFREVWMSMDSARHSRDISSPFFELKKRLIPFVDYEKGFRSNIDLSKNLAQTQCRQDREPRLAIQKLALQQNEKTDAIKANEAKGDAAYKTRFTLLRSDCQKPGVPFVAVARIDVRPLDIIINFVPSEMKEGFGHHLATIDKRAMCQIIFSHKQKLQFLNCQGLGQTESETSHILMTKFQYVQNSNTLIKMTADRFENFNKSCDDRKENYCISLEVPLSGKIKVSENLVKASSRDKYERELQKINEEQRRLNALAAQQKSQDGVAVKAPVPRMQPARKAVEGSRNQSLQTKKLNQKPTSSPQIDAQPIDEGHGDSSRLEEFEKQIRERLGMQEGQDISAEQMLDIANAYEREVSKSNKNNKTKENSDENKVDAGKADTGRIEDSKLENSQSEVGRELEKKPTDNDESQNQSLR